MELGQPVDANAWRRPESEMDSLRKARDSSQVRMAALSESGGYVA